MDDEGSPIAGATLVGPIRKRNHMGTCYPAMAFQVESGADGRFTGTLDAVPAASQRRALLEWVEAPGFDRERVEAREGDWSALESGRSLDGILVVLRRVTSVRVTIVGADGGPLPEAWLGCEAGGESLRLGTVPGGGEFVHRVHEGAEDILFARCLGRESPRIGLRGRCRRGEETPVEIRFPDLLPGQISLRLPDGIPGPCELAIDGGGSSTSVDPGACIATILALESGPRLAELRGPEGELLASEWIDVAPRATVEWRPIVVPVVPAVDPPAESEDPPPPPEPEEDR